MRLIKKLLIFVLTIIIILVIAAVVLLNMTPKKLHIDSIEISGMSFAELGLSDVKFIDIIKGFKNLGKVDESKVVTNGYNNEEEKAKTETLVKGSSLEGKDNYASIVSEKVTYDKQYLISYDDKTIAFMLNNAVQSADSSKESEAVKYLKDANITIKELTLSKDNKSLRVVCSVDLKEFKGEIEGNIPDALKTFVKIPEKVLLVSELSIEDIGSESGKMIIKHKDICINGNNDDPISKAIIKVIVQVTGSEEDSIASINEKVGQAVADVIGNLGKIGSAEVNDQNEVIGAVTIGMVGLYNNKVTLITFVAD